MAEQETEQEPLTLGAMLAANLKGEANYSDEEMTKATLDSFDVPGSIITTKIGDVIGTKGGDGEVTIIKGKPNHG